jgi:hypothetical protein
MMLYASAENRDWGVGRIEPRSSSLSTAIGIPIGLIMEDGGDSGLIEQTDDGHQLKKRRGVFVWLIPLGVGSRAVLVILGAQLFVSGGISGAAFY